jgi:hypothetical protein
MSTFRLPVIQFTYESPVLESWNGRFKTAAFACSRSGKRRMGLLLLRFLCKVGFCFMASGLHSTGQGFEKRACR